jgi:hypothetical protein
LKLRLSEPLGLFEAIEALCLGMQGKLALWTAIDAMKAVDPRVGYLNLSELIARARKQHETRMIFPLADTAPAVLLGVPLNSSVGEVRTLGNGTAAATRVAIPQARQDL